MTDGLDVDAAAQFARVQRNGGHTMAADWTEALVAELRTARAERDAIAAEKKQLRGHASELIVLRDALRAERDALAARIEAASALCDAADAQVHDHFGGDGSMVNTAQIRAALSGATEPADPEATP